MHTPLGVDDVSRCIRGHEMIHAKISPTTEDFKGWLSRGVASEKALVVAEESRVNFLASKIGYPIGEFLADGRELMDAKMMAAAGDWQGLVYSAAAGAFTAGKNAWIDGSREINPVYGKNVENLIEIVETFWETEWKMIFDYTDKSMSHAKRTAYTLDKFCKILPIEEAEIVGISVATNMKVVSGELPGIDNDGCPRYQSFNVGFTYSERLAEMIEQISELGDVISNAGKDDNPLRPVQLGDPIRRGGQAWHKLVWGRLKPMRPVIGAISKKRLATNTGKNPRRITRLLTDPERRIFDRTIKTSGGIVLIDGSGSMSFNSDHIEKMVMAAPGCTVAVYSASDYHNGWNGSDPTIHLLAENGKMLTKDEIVSVAENLNGGNGCDLPALEWAISKRNIKKQPIVWVTDGCCHESAYENVRCATLAQKNEVMFAGDCWEAIDVLRKLRNSKVVKTTMPYGFEDAIHSVYRTTRLKGDARRTEIVSDPD